MVLLFVVTWVVRIGAVKINKPRRPCAGPRQLHSCVPAFDGAANGRGSGLDRRISTPARYALPGRLMRIRIMRVRQ